MSWSQLDLSVSTIWTASCMWIIFGMGQVLSLTVLGGLSGMVLLFC
jgi:hypothetical protein